MNQTIPLKAKEEKMDHISKNKTTISDVQFAAYMVKEHLLNNQHFRGIISVKANSQDKKIVFVVDNENVIENLPKSYYGVQIVFVINKTICTQEPSENFIG